MASRQVSACSKSKTSEEEEEEEDDEMALIDLTAEPKVKTVL